MACLDVLSPDNYISANITLAKLFGLQTAVYWAELSRVLGRVKKKMTFDDCGFFTLDRDYITNRTTLTYEEQLQCDQILAGVGVLGVDPEDVCRVSVDTKLLLSIIIEGDSEDLIKKVQDITTKVVPKQRKLAKTDAIKLSMKRYITEPDAVLYDAYCNWVEVIADNRRINRVAVESFQETITKYTTDTKVRKLIIEIAAAHTYIDAHWAISVYEKMHTTNPGILQPQKVGSAVKTDVIF